MPALKCARLWNTLSPAGPALVRAEAECGCREKDKLNQIQVIFSLLLNFEPCLFPSEVHTVTYIDICHS